MDFSICVNTKSAQLSSISTLNTVQRNIFYILTDMYLFMKKRNLLLDTVECIGSVLMHYNELTN